jgi:hypothetical protein
MQEFTTEQIQERFEKLPPEIRQAISSDEVLERMRSIGRKHNLMIDQIGDLVNQICLVMLGLAKSSNFVRDTSALLSIDNEKAKAIATDINSEIFNGIKSSMRALEEKADEEAPPSTIGASNRNFGSGQKFSGAGGGANGGVLRDMPANAPVRPSANASLERAGNFEIEPEMPGAPMAGTATTGAAAARNMSGVGKWGMVAPEATAADHAEILHGIENPVSHRQQVETREDKEHYEPLVDQLLKGPAAIPLEKITVKAPIDIPAAAKKESVKPSVPRPPVNLPTSDPYREAVK